MSRLAAALAASLCAAPALAQAAFVVPARYEAHDAPAMGELAGLSNAFQQQVLVRDRLLARCKGKTITALAVRRDVQYPAALRGGKARLTISLSETTRDPTQASAVFAENRGPAPVTVFAGEVAVPTAPAVSGREPVPWAAPQAIEFAFTTPFAYGGGHLCIEIHGEPSPTERTPMWPVDTEAGPATSARLAFAGRPGDPRVSAAVISGEFAPGSEIVLMSTGPVGTACIMMLALAADDTGLDLAGYGSPGSRLHVTPFATVGANYPRQMTLPLTRVEHGFVLPATPAMFGAAFAVQWLQAPNETKPAGWVTSQLFRVRLGQSVPSCDGATVRTPAGLVSAERGDVLRHVTPVLRLTAR